MLERTIAIFSSSRADVGPLTPVVEGIDADPRFSLLLLLAGTHGSDTFGTPRDPFSVSSAAAIERFAEGLVDARPREQVSAGAQIAQGTAAALGKSVPDALVVLGDRWELLFAVPAAVLLGVPVVHLHGGEVTEGAIDERVRHAVTKLADLHLCATDDAARRLLQMGEPHDRVVVTGAPALDRFRDVTPATDAELHALLGRPVARPFGVVTYHPPTAVNIDVASAARAVFEAAAVLLGSALITFPGLEPHYEEVVEQAHRTATKHQNVSLVRSVGASYPAVLAAADVMAGNSSSGIIEAASFGLPVVDVGERQSGRMRGPNVVHVPEGHDAVVDGLRRALEPGFRRGLACTANPYGDGQAVPRILDALAGPALQARTPKPFVDRGRS